MTLSVMMVQDIYQVLYKVGIILNFEKFIRNFYIWYVNVFSPDCNRVVFLSVSAVKQIMTHAPRRLFWCSSRFAGNAYLMQHSLLNACTIRSWCSSIRKLRESQTTAVFVRKCKKINRIWSKMGKRVVSGKPPSYVRKIVSEAENYNRARGRWKTPIGTGEKNNLESGIVAYGNMTKIYSDLNLSDPSIFTYFFLEVAKIFIWIIIFILFVDV